MFSPEIRKRLSEISRGKTAGDNPAKDIPQPADYTFDFEFSGEEKRNEMGAFLVSTYRMSELMPESRDTAAGFASVSALGQSPSSLLFLDLETCGLAGVPVFLVGTMRLAGDELEVRQYFARDYSEEKSMLFSFSRLAEKVGGFITFNGKSFDVPFLCGRMAYHRLEFSPPRVHHDLVIEARRRWRSSLPNCRLQTIESFICCRNRSGDIPGSEIPGLYHDYVKTGEIRTLLPVFKHNILDLLTMVELMPKLKK